MGRLSEVIAAANEHATWANTRIFAAASSLSPEEFGAPRPEAGASIEEILIHLLESQEVWIERAFGLPAGRERDAAELPATAALQAWSIELDGRLHQRVWQIGELGLAASVTYTTPRGTWTRPRWQMLHHQAFHQMQHRSELALLLTASGHSPADIDMLYYLRERNAAR